MKSKSRLNTEKLRTKQQHNKMQNHRITQTHKRILINPHFRQEKNEKLIIQIILTASNFLFSKLKRIILPTFLLIQIVFLRHRQLDMS